MTLTGRAPGATSGGPPPPLQPPVPPAPSIATKCALTTKHTRLVRLSIPEMSPLCTFVEWCRSPLRISSSRRTSRQASPSRKRGNTIPSPPRTNGTGPTPPPGGGASEHPSNPVEAKRSSANPRPTGSDGVHSAGCAPAGSRAVAASAATNDAADEAAHDER